jgi:hypothetical protein
MMVAGKVSWYEHPAARVSALHGDTSDYISSKERSGCTDFLVGSSGDGLSSPGVSFRSRGAA